MDERTNERIHVLCWSEQSFLEHPEFFPRRELFFPLDFVTLMETLLAMPPRAEGNQECFARSQQPVELPSEGRVPVTAGTRRPAILM